MSIFTKIPHKVVQKKITSASIFVGILLAIIKPAVADCTPGYGYSGQTLNVQNTGAQAVITLGATRTLCTKTGFDSHVAAWAGSQTGRTAWAQAGYLQDTSAPDPDGGGTGGTQESYWEVTLPNWGHVIRVSTTTSPSATYTVMYFNHAWQLTNPGGTKRYPTVCSALNSVSFTGEISGLENYFYGTAAAPIAFSQCAWQDQDVASTWGPPSGWSSINTVNAKTGGVSTSGFTAWDIRG